MAMLNIFKQPNLKVRVVGRNIDDLLPLLKEYPVTVLKDNSKAEPDFIISHGGDGSMLGAERQYPGIPKCPIRDDAQNPKCASHSVKSILDKLFAGKLKHSRLDKLVAIGPKGHRISGINDIIISRQLVSSAIRYRISIDGNSLREQVIADSLVIATSFGSTGYFQSITGGNFSTGIGLAYNNAVDGPRFNLVAPGKAMKIEILRGPAVVCADNNPDLIKLKTGDILTVELDECHTDVFGIDIFRCPDCFQLRRNGKNS